MDPAAIIEAHAREVLEPAWEEAGIKPVYPAMSWHVSALLQTAGISVPDTKVAKFGGSFSAIAIVDLASHFKGLS